jgi:hypothetical protein
MTMMIMSTIRRVKRILSYCMSLGALFISNWITVSYRSCPILTFSFPLSLGSIFPFLYGVLYGVGSIPRGEV